MSTKSLSLLQTTYHYTSDRLTKITYPDGKFPLYAFDPTSGYLTSVRNFFKLWIKSVVYCRQESIMKALAHKKLTSDAMLPADQGWQSQQIRSILCIFL